MSTLADIARRIGVPIWQIVCLDSHLKEFAWLTGLTAKGATFSLVPFDAITFASKAAADGLLTDFKIGSVAVVREVSGASAGG